MSNATNDKYLDIDPNAYVTDGIPRREDSHDAHMLVAIGHDAKEQAAKNVRANQATTDRIDAMKTDRLTWQKKYGHKRYDWLRG